MPNCLNAIATATAASFRAMRQQLQQQQQQLQQLQQNGSASDVIYWYRLQKVQNINK